MTPGRPARRRRVLGQAQDRGRDLHRQLGSRQRADRDGAVPDGQRQQVDIAFCPRTTAWRAAPWPRSRLRALPARSRSPARTATARRSIAWPSGPRRSTSGRTPATSARPPATPRSSCARTRTSPRSPAPPRSRPRGGDDMTSILLAPQADHEGQPQRRPRRRLDHQGRPVQGRHRQVPSPPAADGPLDHRTFTPLGATGARGRCLPGAVREEPPMSQAASVARRQHRPRRLVVPIHPPADGDRHPPAGHGRRAGDHLARIQPRFRRQLPHPAQPLEPLGPERLDRDHGHRHGPDHRVAQHRPLGRVARWASWPTRWRWSRPTGSRRPSGSASSSHTPGSSPWSWASPSARCSGAITGVPRRVWRQIPSFIVTLGGFLVWRGLIFRYAQGQTLAPMDEIFHLLGGGPDGSLGFWPSWILGFLACAGIVYSLISSRRRRHKYGFPVRPRWAEIVIGVAACGAVLGAVVHRERLCLAALAGHAVRAGARDHRAAGRPHHPDGHREPRPDPDRRRRWS